ncbi:DUF2914 domain-containing protein [bacterium]|nr:DUF2914 domain-containing protein [bacterium]
MFKLTLILTIGLLVCLLFLGSGCSSSEGSADSDANASRAQKSVGESALVVETGGEAAPTVTGRPQAEAGETDAPEPKLKSGLGERDEIRENSETPADTASEARASADETGSYDFSQEVAVEASSDILDRDVPSSLVSPEGLSVTRAYICRGIEESEPTDAGRSFLPKEDGLNRLCCFSEIAGAARPDTIWHVWYWGDRELGRVPLEVKSMRWRTWSRKQVFDEWKGEWHVDIVDRNEFLLYRLEFSIE